MKYSEMTPDQVEKRKEYHQKYHVLWYQANKERLKPIHKEYAQTHRVDSVKRTQRYVAKHKEKVKTYNSYYNNNLSGWWRSHFFGAKRKNLEMLLTRDEFDKITSLSCRYCGFSGIVGIDRIDNSKGYTQENSAPCCKVFNYMKKNLSVQDFISHITKIYNHNKN